MGKRKTLPGISENSRRYEEALTRGYRRLTAAIDRELGLELDILDGLGRLGVPGLETGIPVPEEWRRERELRCREEEWLAQQLPPIAALIAHRLAALEEASAPDVEDEENRGGIPLVPGLAEIAAECDAKLPDFTGNHLYRYLRERGYGTDRYHASPLFRYLDGWIAGLCNFNNNYASELMLLAMRQEISSPVGETAKPAAETGQPARFRDRCRQIAAEVRDARKQADALHENLARYALKTDVRCHRLGEMLARAWQGRSVDDVLALIQQASALAQDATALKILDLSLELRAVREEQQSLTASFHQALAAYRQAGSLEVSLWHAAAAGWFSFLAVAPDLDELLRAYMAGEVGEQDLLAALGCASQIA